ncbi:MAG: HNH endonuclease [Erysipelotrichaceae bacterium]|nr:HNH endonuclease [Erysipelotrichaceae bacterium]MBQ4020263.1 HNH endonuclease [Erysipelotrichaceae bacterium]
MLTYVINKNGQPLMPTRRCGKVYRLLKQGKAKCIRCCPFTIQLLYEAEANTQEVSLGVDTGSRHIGISASTKKKVLYEADVELRNDIVELLSTRREARRARRNRKTRYRAPRFDNRVSCKKEGWLSPSVRQKVDSHLKVIADIHKILPISKVVIEVASFDTQLLKAVKNGELLPHGTDYQFGEQLGFYNTREYVLFRDNHECQCCHGKSRDKILNVHHIESRKTGGDAPDNLITLCETCHTGYHRGTVKLPSSIRRGMKFNDAAFMGIVRWSVYNRLKKVYPSVELAYGYKTKNTRIKAGLPKEHYIDARCISGNPMAKSLDYVFYQKKARCHNRQIHKFKVYKDGLRKPNQAPYLVKGFRLWDKVLYNSEECFVQGRRSSGFFQLKKMDGTLISASVSYKKLRLVETAKHYITERRVVSSPCLKAGVSTAEI